MTIPSIPVLRKGDPFERLDDRAVRKALTAGTLVRVTSGVYAEASAWNALAPIQRHRLRVREVLLRRRSPVIVSHFAAAAVWDMDVLGNWPETVGVLVARTSGGRSSGALRRRTRDLVGAETVPWGIHRITSPAQTALDLARAEPFTSAVAVLDQALWTGRDGGALTTREKLEERYAADAGHPGHARAGRALEFARALAANVRESQSRVVIARLGFPEPRLQERRVLASGRIVYADLYFPDFDHWCEIDGRWKYSDPRFLAGRTAQQAVVDEKNRENEIRREVRGFSRWEALDADHPERIWDILTRAGLPSTRPRP